MVIIRKCDRCKGEIGEGIEGADNELHFTKKRNTREGYDKLIHLCDACLKDFDKFMEKKESQDNTPFQL